MRRYFLFILSLSLGGCGYQWQRMDMARPSILVPFILGDEEGMFTHELVQAITASGVADVSLREGDYRLQVEILDTSRETIGFRKDKQKVDGTTKRNMVACEGRKIVSVNVTLYKKETDEVVFGPCQLEADADFDCVDGDSYQDLTFVNPNGVSQAVLPFSLGQLEPYEAAQDAAIRSLYSGLAQKIVDVVFWSLPGEKE